MSLKWERRKPGYYRLVHHDHRAWPRGSNDGIVAMIARGADDKWWMEYLDKTQGWIFKRCKSLGNAKAVAEECCKQ